MLQVKCEQYITRSLKERGRERERKKLSKLVQAVKIEIFRMDGTRQTKIYQELDFRLPLSMKWRWQLLANCWYASNGEERRNKRKKNIVKSWLVTVICVIFFLVIFPSTIYVQLFVYSHIGERKYIFDCNICRKSTEKLFFNFRAMDDARSDSN